MLLGPLKRVSPYFFLGVKIDPDNGGNKIRLIGDHKMSDIPPKKGSQLVLHHLFWVRSSFIPVVPKSPVKYRREGSCSCGQPGSIPQELCPSLGIPAGVAKKKVLGCGCYVIHRSDEEMAGSSKEWLKRVNMMAEKNKQKKNLRVHSRTVLVWTHEADPNREKNHFLLSLSKKVILSF